MGGEGRPVLLGDVGGACRRTSLYLLPVSNFLSCHLFLRKVIYLGLCSHLEDTFLWLTSGWLYISKELWRRGRLSLASTRAVWQMAPMGGERLGCAQFDWQFCTGRRYADIRKIPVSLSWPPSSVLTLMDSKGFFRITIIHNCLFTPLTFQRFSYVLSNSVLPVLMPSLSGFRESPQCSIS